MKRPLADSAERGMLLSLSLEGTVFDGNPGGSRKRKCGKAAGAGGTQAGLPGSSSGGPDLFQALNRSAGRARCAPYHSTESR